MQIDILTKDTLGIIPVLAHKIWPSTFKDILSSEQIAYMLETMYAPHVLHTQYERGVAFLSISENGVPIGFASYEVIHAIPAKAKLHKLYVLPSSQKNGAGRQLLLFIFHDLQRRHIAKLELNVNRYNNAVAFYEKLGFSTIKEEDIDIGNGYWMNDYVMERSV